MNIALGPLKLMVFNIAQANPLKCGHIAQVYRDGKWFCKNCGKKMQ